jgi:hypothetical protein
MMKNVFVLVGMVMAGITLSAQTWVSIDGHLTTDFSNTISSIGLGANFARFDLLAGAEFWFYNSEERDTNYQMYNTDKAWSEHYVEFFAGVAPKVMTAEKWTVSIPLLAKVYYRRDELKFENKWTYSASSPKAAEYFGYAFAIGPRVYYAVHKNWDIYAGFSVDAFSSQNTKRVYWKSSPTETYMVEFNSNVYFDNEKLVLGIRYKI